MTRRHHMDDDKRAEIAEDIEAWKRAEGNIAMDVLTKAIERTKESDLNQWSLGYFRGQLTTIIHVLQPDSLHTTEARAALDAFSKQVTEYEFTRKIK